MMGTQTNAVVFYYSGNSLYQGNRSVVEYSLEFHTLAASSGWNEAALLIMFRQGLNSKLLAELACKDDDLTLDQLITLGKSRSERNVRKGDTRVRITSE